MWHKPRPIEPSRRLCYGTRSDRKCEQRARLTKQRNHLFSTHLPPPPRTIVRSLRDSLCRNNERPLERSLPERDARSVAPEIFPPEWLQAPLRGAPGRDSPQI